MSFSESGNDVSRRPRGNDGHARSWQLRTVQRRPRPSATGPRAGGPTPASAPWSAAGLDAQGGAEFRVLSEVRPWTRHLRRRRPGGPGPRRQPARPGRRPRRRRRLPAAQLGGGRHHASGPPPTSAPSSCRSSTSTGPRRSATSCDRSDPKVVVTPERFGYTDHLADVRGAARASTRCPTWLVVGDTPPPTPSRPAPPGSPTLLDGEPDRRTGRRRRRRAGAHRLHLRHHARPQGRHPLAQHARLRDPPARPHVPGGRAAADHRRAGRPLHRDAQRLPRAAAARPPGEPRRRVGPGRRSSA